MCLAPELSLIFLVLALAGVFTDCYRKDEQRAQKLLTRVSEAWGKTTCLQLALEAKNMNFVSHGGVQVGSQQFSLEAMCPRVPSIQSSWWVAFGLCNQHSSFSLLTGFSNQGLVGKAVCGQWPVAGNYMHAVLPPALHQPHHLQVLVAAGTRMH